MDKYESIGTMSDVVSKFISNFGVSGGDGGGGVAIDDVHFNDCRMCNIGASYLKSYSDVRMIDGGDDLRKLIAVCLYDIGDDKAKIELANYIIRSVAQCMMPNITKYIQDQIEFINCTAGKK